MNWNEVPAGDINAANQRLWKAFGKNAGLVAARINTDPDFTANIARLIISGGCELSKSQRIAQKIMGNNFFGIKEAADYFGITATEQQLKYLAEIPFSKEALEACRNTHILIAVLPISILEISRIANKKKVRIEKYGFHATPEFNNIKVELGWHLVRKKPVTNSMGVSWREQERFLSKDEEIPTVQVMIYTIIGHFLQTGERLFEKTKVRCVDGTGDHDANIGRFTGREGLYLNTCKDGYPVRRGFGMLSSMCDSGYSTEPSHTYHSNHGLAAAKKRH